VEDKDNTMRVDVDVSFARTVWLASILLPCLALPALGRQPEPAAPQDEYTVKAVFLFSFGRYVQWPAETFAKRDDPFVIGIAGEDTFGGAMDEIAAKKTVQGRRILVTRLASLNAYRDCHILFLSRSLAPEQVTAFLKEADGKGVLVVGETPGLAERGAVANFFVDGDRIRFEINSDAARRSRLQLDAKLLSLGKPVGAARDARE
jgi:hypothetical protein